jgi:hypothetical protein
MFCMIKYILVEFSHEAYAMFTFSDKCLFFICVRVIVLEIVIYKFLQGRFSSDYNTDNIEYKKTYI